MERSALPALLLTLLLGLLMQGMLASAHFSTVRAESVYRILYLAALTLNLLAVRRLQPATLSAAVLPLAPIVMAVAITYFSVSDRDVPAQVTLLLLPIAHGAAAGCMLLLPKDEGDG
ncbi:hypothetical protein [Pseudoduganella violaceinigra]|uniref:hypothetical protein n=1 Tax=Pseudoduganella violaceinigra TaxID=246602 RepID=UPI0003F7808D|nr:hypothetical protein [Pseudoduganella violaceinigra]